VPQSAATANFAEDDLRLKLYAPANELESSVSQMFGKTVNNSIFNSASRASIINIQKAIEIVPVTKSKKSKTKKKEEKAPEEAAGSESPKKGKGKGKKKPTAGLPEPA
jgi:hypothetical protein